MFAEVLGTAFSDRPLLLYSNVIIGTFTVTPRAKSHWRPLRTNTIEILVHCNLQAVIQRILLLYKAHRLPQLEYIFKQLYQKHKHSSDFKQVYLLLFLKWPQTHFVLNLNLIMFDRWGNQSCFAGRYIFKYPGPVWSKLCNYSLFYTLADPGGA